MKRTKNFALDNPDWKKSVPQPVLESHPEYLELYDFAWMSARDHVRDIPGLPQTPYMDEGFWNADIWIWDTCFMLHFCKYAPDVFPGIETLKNFYTTIHDGGMLPMVYPDELASTTFPAGKLTQLCLHLPDNPPLFAWSEYSYALMTGDKDHLRDLLLRKRYLQKHFAFLENLAAPGWKTPCTRGPTRWVKRENGYYWEGGHSGMDNTPRGRRNGKAEQERPYNPQLLWVDAISQQAMSCYFIAKIAEILGESSLKEEWMGKYEVIREKVNRLYWDDKDGLYYDIEEADLSKNKCVTPASFWPMLSHIPTPEQAERMCRYLTDPNQLGGPTPWVTLARDDPDFRPEDGDYWRGCVWLPTAYMGIKGLECYGKYDLARETSEKILRQMYCTWREYEPHTIWECYHPSKNLPGRHSGVLVRDNFCGWSALGPISLLIENVIGITGADAFANLVFWHPPKEIHGRLGIRNYTFGAVTASFVYENGFVLTESDHPFTLRINGKDYPVPAGKAKFSCPGF